MNASDKLGAGPLTLLVCTANVCRSPMAEALWRAAAADRAIAAPVASAGLDADPGRAADPFGSALLAERGLDLGTHRASRFRADLALDCELILVMEPEHMRRIKTLAPVLAGRVHLLGRWGAGPIRDPFGAHRAVYETCLLHLENSVHAWLNRLS
jgi:protein-tyrosine phosphatase